MTEVAVLLATYNGGRFLAEQLADLGRQTLADWTLYVRDDGSTDDTPALLAAAAAADHRIDLLGGGPRLGPVQNFGVLLGHALAAGHRWFFFCDQDDRWRIDKLARLTDRLAALAPCALVHSDLAVLDAAGRRTHRSFLRLRRLRHQNGVAALRTLLTMNFVTGAALGVDRALAELAHPFPAEAVMHDHWLALCATATGRLAFDPAALVGYRQHGGNTIGAARPEGLTVGRLRSWRECPPWDAASRGAREFEATVRQAEALHRRLGERGAAGPGLRLVDAYIRGVRVARPPLARPAAALVCPAARQALLPQAALAARLLWGSSESTLDRPAR